MRTLGNASSSEPINIACVLLLVNKTRSFDFDSVNTLPLLGAKMKAPRRPVKLVMLLLLLFEKNIYKMYVIMANVMIWMHMLSTLLVLTGALNWGLLGLFNVNILHWILGGLFKGAIERLVYVLVGAAGAALLLQRDTWLPFLGRGVYPCGSLVEKTPTGANTRVRIQAEPGVNVVYWAAEPSSRKVEVNPWVAYSAYANAGVAKADAKGIAVLAVRSPTAYRVPSGRTLKPHVHYRICRQPGMLSRVYTAEVS